jgi:hypothetical protein
MSWKGRWGNKSCRLADEGFDRWETMEHLLAHHVVKGIGEGMPRFNSLWLASMEFTSRVDRGRWLNSGFRVYLSMRGCSFTSWAFSKAHLAGTEWIPT